LVSNLHIRGECRKRGHASKGEIKKINCKNKGRYLRRWKMVSEGNMKELKCEKGEIMKHESSK
jgi:hypothetical protein